MEFKDLLLKIVSENEIEHPNVYTNRGQGLENIDKAFLFKLRSFHQLSKDVEIYRAYSSQEFLEGGFFEAERTFYKSVLILEHGISLMVIEDTSGWAKAEDLLLDIPWGEIENVEVVSQIEEVDGKKVKQFTIRFYAAEGNDYSDIGLNNFGKLTSEKHGLEIAELINTILKDFWIRERANGEKLGTILEGIEEKIGSFQFTEALAILEEEFDWDKVFELEPDDKFPLVMMKAKCLDGLQLFDDGISIINESISKLKDSNELQGWESRIFGFRGMLFEKKGKFNYAIQDFCSAIDKSSESSEKKANRINLQSAYDGLRDSFLSLNIDNRKTVLIHDQVKSTELNEFLVLDKSNLPSGILFPVGHPKLNEVYVAHPFQKEKYVQYSAYESLVFDNRFEEFSYFLQCLGAKSIEVKVLKGKEIDNKSSKALNVNASLEFGKKIVKNSGDLATALKSNSSENEVLSTSRIRRQTYTPVKRPYIPENLTWYHNEPSWQFLYQQRINGNIEQHHDVISSQNFYSISKSDQLKIKAAFKTIFAHAKVDVDELTETTFSSNESIEWEVLVEFEPLQNLKETHTDGSVSIEKQIDNPAVAEYLEELKFLLEDDGVIDDKERSILERLRERKGITKEVAMDLESKLLLSSKLSENEKEYLEECTEMLRDGISDKERKILMRFANRLQITEQRVKELEGSISGFVS